MKPRINLAKIPSQKAIKAELERRQCPFRTLFPDSGPLRRELYAKHMQFFAADRQYARVSS